MTTGTRTLSIEETLLEPQALPPPPTRHALLVILIALAALLHVVTIGTGDLYSETEGQYAGAAREMVASHNWLLPTNNGIPRLQKPPLLYWAIIASYKILGVNEAAARLPVALAVIATVALIFLIGEKLTDYWRGFIAGLIFLSFCGTFLLARIVMPEPLVTAFMAGAMFCGICGYERRRHRHLWFAGVWVFAALACLTKGVLGIVYPTVVFVLLSIFYRTARIRFRALLRWEYVVIFLLIVMPWHIWAQWHFPHYFRYARSDWLGHLRGLTDETHDFLGVPAYQFVILHVAWWFPWSIALLPGVDFCLAPCYPAARSQFRRCIAVLLDGCGVHSAALFGTATGLLFDEYVERVCALGSHGLGSHSPIVAGRRRGRGGRHRSDPCGRSAFHGACRECIERNVGSNGRPPRPRLRPARVGECDARPWLPERKRAPHSSNNNPVAVPKRAAE